MGSCLHHLRGGTPSLKLGPGGPVVLLAVAAVEWRFVGDDALSRPPGECVVLDLAGERTRLHIPDLLPLRPREADARQRLAGCERCPPSAIVPSIHFVLPKNRELNTIDSAKFFNAKA